MSGLELNKIAASILLAALVVMLVGNIADILYKPNIAAKHRGFEVAVKEGDNTQNTDATKEEKPFDIKTLMATASAADGQNVFKKCAACHSPEKGGPNRVGPKLWNVAHREKASVSDYKYSAALTKLGGTWDVDALAQFLHKPSAYAPGTKMSFAGISKPEDIANVIAYLETLKD
jgi:cytochrome c